MVSDMSIKTSCIDLRCISSCCYCDRPRNLHASLSCCCCLRRRITLEETRAAPPADIRGGYLRNMGQNRKSLADTRLRDLSDALWRTFWIFKVFLKYLSNYFPNETPRGGGSWILVDLRFARFSTLSWKYSCYLHLRGSAKSWPHCTQL